MCWQKAINFVRDLQGLCADGKSITSLQQSIVIADLNFRKSQGLNEGVTLADQTDVDILLAQVKAEADLLTHFSDLSRQ
jgi:hypothetical protein